MMLTRMGSVEKTPWSKRHMYYAYVPTFYEDSSREPKGVGSIRGITEKLDYLSEDLGIDALWVSPFYKGPLLDGGYDVTDQTDVHPDFGTRDDIKELIDECHVRGIKIIFDYVANHTSTEHEWFQKSRRRERGYEDFYHWHPGKRDTNGKPIPPNNWPSRFSEPNKKARERGEFPELGPDDPTPAVSMWQWDDLRGEFYMRTFIKEQADLNWNNPAVKKAQLDIIRFWREYGVDGFRVDAVNHMAKDPSLVDEKPNPNYVESMSNNPMEQWTEDHYCNYWPLLREYINEMCDVLEEKNDGEDPYMLLESYATAKRLYKMNSLRPHLAATFNFVVMASKWDAMTRKKLIDNYLNSLPKGAIPNFVNGNMDNPRTATVLGDRAARAAGMMSILLPGMTIIHNGEELGLHDGDVPMDRIKDPNGFRDNYRTPMIWDDRLPNAGFSRADSSKLYLPINRRDLPLAVERQKTNPKSVLRMYRAAMELTRTVPAFRDGKYVASDTDNSDVYAFVRATNNEHAFVLTNFSNETQVVRVPEALSIPYESMLSSVDVRENLRSGIDLIRGVELQPNESVVLVPKR